MRSSDDVFINSTHLSVTGQLLSSCTIQNQICVFILGFLLFLGFKRDWSNTELQENIKDDNYMSPFYFLNQTTV